MILKPIFFFANPTFVRTNLKVPLGAVGSYQLWPRGRTTTCTHQTAAICVVRASLPRRSGGIPFVVIVARRARLAEHQPQSRPPNGVVRVREPPPLSPAPCCRLVSSPPGREEDELLLLLRRRRSVSPGGSRQAAGERLSLLPLRSPPPL